MTTNIDTPVISGYEIIEQIYCGSRTKVYRATRKQDSLPVVIKCLAAEYPSFNELLQFRNQYVITENLQIPGILRSLSLEPYGNGYALVMEDMGGISLQEYALILQKEYGSFSDINFLTECLYIALELVNILHKLNQQRIIHKDIKPANILINPETKQVKLIDFSIASLLPRETQEIKSPNILEGTLAYISPEQTGRMNRGIDYRSDFYSLGVTFYELLTGELPFKSNDAMELVHCHIAKQPPEIKKTDSNRSFANKLHLNPLLGKEMGQEIPQVLSDIVMKLMAKNAEDRYQSALGLKYDLEICLQQLKDTGNIEKFEIAQRDICDKFIIPEKLYGRETEIQELLTSFDRISQGNSELMLVAGFSGIGKTAVVNEVHKPIVKQRGYFIKGKYDQFNRNIPLSAFVQAFRNLMRQLLTESDKTIKQWKQKIIQVLGENAQVIIEVIPELEIIIGKQPPVPELSGSAAENRFNLLFQNFLKLFTTKEHPLVIFLDDLQWADSASLKLIELLMNHGDWGYLLLIGAYRDNEVSPTHPLIKILDEIQQIGAIINKITLKPLSQLNLNQLVTDTLNCPEDVGFPLSQLIYQKTEGNPFFATQFLKSLHEDNLIQFNLSEGFWECDIAQIKKQSLTSDVVEFMMLQLRRLPESTQNILKLAACIGNQFDLATLAIVSEKSQIEIASYLWNALQAGLILPQSDIYKFFVGRENQIENQTQNQEIRENVIYRFLHDRIQQAAYCLIPEDQKQKTHYHIGQLLLQRSSNSEQEERLFEIVNHLNIGIALISQNKEREDLVQLNLKAGQKAKTATAYTAAIEFFNVGIELLGVNCWQKYYDLSLALHSEIAQASYLNTNFEQMEQWADVVLQEAKTLLDTIKVQHTRIMGTQAQGKLMESVEIGLQVLKELGIEFPQQLTQEDVGKAYGVSRTLWADKPPQSLVNLPTMSDPHLLAAMNILTILVSPAFVVSPNLMLLVIFKQIELSVLNGNTPVSVMAYSDYGLALCGIMGDINNGYEFGELAFNLLEKLQAKPFQGRCWYVVSTHIKHWKNALSDILSKLETAYNASLETGDLGTLGWIASIYCAYTYHQGQNLGQIAEKVEAYRQTIIKYKQAFCLPFLETYQQTALNLLGEEEIPYNLTGKIFNQEISLPQLQATNQRTALFFWFLNQSILYYIFAKNDEAVETSAKTAQYLDGGTGMFMVAVYFYFDALIQLAMGEQITPQERQSILLKVEQNQDKLHHWATLSPENHQHRWELVEAERCRFIGNKLDAMEAYDFAIAKAKENGYIQDVALANELKAKFYLEWGKEREAIGYMQEAYYCYSRWGAKAKTDDLETRYPQLLKPILQRQQFNHYPLETINSTYSQTSLLSTCSSTTSSTSISDVLDFDSILKAAQSISSCIELDQLISNLTQIIVENSGAKKSVLILPENQSPENDNWLVKAITKINKQLDEQSKIETTLTLESIDDCQEIPQKIIHYVTHIQQTIVIDNCQIDIPGVIGEYMIKHQPKSVLCTPIINQGNLVGILYLENEITAGVFTPQRQQIINLLSSQAAISIENAQLYSNLQKAQLQIVQSEKMSALGNLVAGVAHEMNNPLGFIFATLKQAKPTITDITEHLQLYQETFPESGDEILDHAEEIDLDYSLEDLPKMVDAMVMACDRLKNIGTSLRTFSRADKDYKVSFNIHDGLDSTILILKHRLKGNDNRPAIEVIKEYGNLSQVECFPGQLNQVFMNLLANAIDALEEFNHGLSFEEIKTNPNKITITTVIENDNIKISIADNGKGMSEEVKAKIFDHLFTTKGVGKGTGLGLAIARQIIEEKHGGKLSCNSVLAEGTEFILEMPTS